MRVRGEVEGRPVEIEVPDDSPLAASLRETALRGVSVGHNLGGPTLCPVTETACVRETEWGRACPRDENGDRTEECDSATGGPPVSIPIKKWVFADCPECGSEVTSAEHNHDLDPMDTQRHQGWTLYPCGHHPQEYPKPQCGHREKAMQPAMLYAEDEARYCADCRSLVFADGHVEPVGITGVRTTQR